jgi:2,4-dienoyl-CoA reductase-like NADH-dependent reductase (Old Yellow Enzyme family)
MYEHMTSFLGGPPNEAHLSLYRLWTKGNWGMVISGNVQIDASHLTLGRDMVVPLILDDVSVAPYSKLANIMHGLEHAQNGTIAIMQLSHAGRQSANFMGGRRLFESPKAPSPTPLGRSGQEGLLSSLLYRLMFTTPTAMNEKDIDDVVAGFTRGAQLAEEAGFDGVQLHASHGCEQHHIIHAAHYSIGLGGRLAGIFPVVQVESAHRLVLV